MPDLISSLKPGEPGLTGLLSRLADDTGEVVRAEIAMHKARAFSTVGRVKTAVIFFAVAGVLALAALIALLVGLILTLTPSFGPGLATLTVVVVTLVIAGIVGLVGKGKLAGKTA